MNGATGWKSQWDTSPNVVIGWDLHIMSAPNSEVTYFKTDLNFLAADQ